MVVAAGFPIVATSSAAVAESLGYSDGGGTPPDQMFQAIARISTAVEVPVTADVERGYGLWPDELVERLVTAGAVGCNVEDSAPGGRLVDVAEQADFIAALRASATQAGLPIVINARLDVFLGRDRANEPQMSLVSEAIKRGRLYLDAGADCVFPIAAREPDVIDALVERMHGPINILCGPGVTPAGLAAAGVARISYGAALFRDVGARFARLIDEITVTSGSRTPG
jgi:2-methylisocitrate lyase-like PEP mutase family enzyme